MQVQFSTAKPLLDRAGRAPLHFEVARSHRAAMDNVMTPAELEHERDLKRLEEQEKLDLEVEKERGPRPLEGFSGAHTSWTPEQDESQAEQVHGEDAAKSAEASQAQ